MRILFAAAHRPQRSPSQRYRFEQFVPYWEKHGCTFDYAWLIDERDDRLFYAPGRLLAKARIFAKSWLKRRADVERAAAADIVIVQREALMTGSTRFERGFKRSGAKFIFDFDDAIWRLDVSKGNRHLRWLKRPAKTDDIIRLADLVIAGNDYLAEYARKLNSNVVTIPTVIDTDRYKPSDDRASRKDDVVVIGWTGSLTSVAHLEQALPMLREVCKRFGHRVHFRIISDRPFKDVELRPESLIWDAEHEAEQLAGIDIGIMPLPDDEWSRGKCGFKGLQYMGMGKAVVLSAVGVNNAIVTDGVNGMLARSDDEWIEKLSRLIADADLRQRLGAAARATVEQRYSVIAWRDEYLRIFNQLTNN